MPFTSGTGGPLTDGTAPTPLVPGSSALSGLVSECHRCALEKLAELNIVAPAGERPYQAVADAGFEHPSREWYLGEIENYARRALGFAANGRPGGVETALGLALKLGILVKEYEVLDLEQPLSAGLRTSEGGRSSADSRRAGKDWRNKQIVASFEANLSKHSLAKTAYSLTAERYGLSGRQVRRIVKAKIRVT